MTVLKQATILQINFMIFISIVYYKTQSNQNNQYLIQQVYCVKLNLNPVVPKVVPFKSSFIVTSVPVVTSSASVLNETLNGAKRAENAQKSKITLQNQIMFKKLNLANCKDSSNAQSFTAFLVHFCPIEELTSSHFHHGSQDVLCRNYKKICIISSII